MRSLPIGSDNLPILGDFGGLGEKKTERRGENGHVACAVMSIAIRASYCYSDWLCVALSSAILAGHGY